MAIGGDLMFNQIPVATKSLDSVQSLLSDADVAILNLEIPLTNATTATPRKSLADRRAKKQFVLKGDPNHGEKLVRAGVDLVSLGNNHAMDFGGAALRTELEWLTSKGIGFSGAGSSLARATKPGALRLPNGATLRFSSFLSFMSDSANETCWPAKPNAPGIASLKFQGSVGPAAKKEIAQIVRGLKRDGAFAVVALHWGIERQTVPTPYQVALARAFVDSGADLIIGHHPHVLQGAELYAGKPIFYSLGNFVSPLPASSALFRISFQKSAVRKVMMFPFQIGGGKISLRKGGGASSEFQRFKTLSQAVAKRYPSSKSVPIPLSLGRG